MHCTYVKCVPAEEFIMLFRYVIDDFEKGRCTTGLVYVTQKTSTKMIYNDSDQKLSRFFDIISFIYNTTTTHEDVFENISNRRCHHTKFQPQLCISMICMRIACLVKT